MPFVYVDPAAISRRARRGGKQLLTPDYFNCFSCHVQGDKKPEGPPEGWAPDLAMAKHRLNPEWIVEWLRDPQKFSREPRCRRSIPVVREDILGGNDERQIHALRDYLMVLGAAPSRGAMQVAQGAGGSQ